MYALQTTTTRSLKATSASLIKIGAKVAAHSYTDNWDEISANEVNYLIVDAFLPEHGFAPAENLEQHYKTLFRLGCSDDSDDDDY
jgi:hypothetical protein